MSGENPVGLNFYCFSTCGMSSVVGEKFALSARLKFQFALAAISCSKIPIVTKSEMRNFPILFELAASN
jgi:hypothetical protein